MAKKKTGRPSVLTPELTQKIVASLRKGVPLTLAAEAAGIHRDTVNDWIRKGREPGASKVLAAFSVTCMEAKAQGAVFLHGLVFEAAMGRRPSKRTASGWTKTRMSPMRVAAAQWLLARRFPEFYGSALEGLVGNPEDEAAAKRSFSLNVILAPEPAPAPAGVAEAE